MNIDSLDDIIKKYCHMKDFLNKAGNGYPYEQCECVGYIKAVEDFVELFNENLKEEFWKIIHNNMNNKIIDDYYR